ncbi:MAG: MBL fold metallo-hydrolase [Deltaproteobacteria bacterium]|nr:MBL fold metallo-hydrolase [Deltaproteobacteria bacterium]
MRIKFWGVRGSIPTPINTDSITDKITRALSLAKGVNLDDPEAIKSFVDSLPMEIKGTCGGNTSCVEVNLAGHNLIFDAGSGLRELGLHYMQGPFGRGQGVAHFFMSHTHWDHIQGFPFFIPAYIPGNKFYVYSPKKDLQAKFTTQQIDQDMFPMKLDQMASTKEFVSIGPEGVSLDGITVDCILLHHPGGSYAYRIKAENKILVYATDGEYQDLSFTALQRYLDFFSQADVLIFDSMYTFSESMVKEGWGHSSSLVGVDMAVKTGVKNLVLFHHEPTYHDSQLVEILEKTTQYYSLVRENSHLEVTLAIEGQELVI